MDVNEQAYGYLHIGLCAFIFASAVFLALFTYNQVIEINHSVTDATENKINIAVTEEMTEQLCSPAEAVYEIISSPDGVLIYVNGTSVNQEGIKLLKAKGSEGIQFISNNFDMRASAKYQRIYNYDSYGNLYSIEYILKS